MRERSRGPRAAGLPKRGGPGALRSSGRHLAQRGGASSAAWPSSTGRLPRSRPGSLARLPRSRSGSRGRRGRRGRPGGSRSSKRGRGSHPAPPPAHPPGRPSSRALPWRGPAASRPARSALGASQGASPWWFRGALGADAGLRARKRPGEARGCGLGRSPSAPAESAREGTGSGGQRGRSNRAVCSCV